MLEQEQKDLKEKGVRAHVVQELEKELFTLYSNTNLSSKPPQLEQRGGAHYSDAACSLIHSIYNDTQDSQPVNVRNNGAISGIPDDSEVEVRCVITKAGPRPNQIGDMSSRARQLLQHI